MNRYYKTNAFKQNKRGLLLLLRWNLGPTRAAPKGSTTDVGGKQSHRTCVQAAEPLSLCLCEWAATFGSSLGSALLCQCAHRWARLLCVVICSVLPVLISFSLSRRLGAELGKSVVYQETNGGKRTLQYLQACSGLILAVQIDSSVGQTCLVSAVIHLWCYCCSWQCWASASNLRWTN